MGEVFLGHRGTRASIFGPIPDDEYAKVVFRKTQSRGFNVGLDIISNFEVDRWIGVTLAPEWAIRLTVNSRRYTSLLRLVLLA